MAAEEREEEQTINRHSRVLPVSQGQTKMAAALHPGNMEHVAIDAARPDTYESRSIQDVQNAAPASYTPHNGENRQYMRDIILGSLFCLVLECVLF